MTKQQKHEYYLRFSRFQKSREKAFAPYIRKALEQQINQYISTRSIDGVNSGGMYSVLIELYKDAGTVYGAKIRASLVGRKKIEQKARMPIGFNERMVELINQYFGMDILNTAEGITTTTKEFIVRVLQQATIEGLGFDDIIKKLQNTELTAARARLIARTETVTAANRGGHIAAKETGLELNKEWLSAIDNRTRDHHVLINGRIVGIDDYFILDGGAQMLIPGDRGGTDGRLDTPISEVANCRCTTLYLPIEK